MLIILLALCLSYSWMSFAIIHCYLFKKNEKLSGLIKNCEIAKKMFIDFETFIELKKL